MCCHTFYAYVDSCMFTDAHAMTKHRQHVYVCSHRHTHHCGLLKPYPADTLTCRNTHGRAWTRPGAVVLAKGCGEKRSNSSPRHDVASAGHPGVYALYELSTFKSLEIPHKDLDVCLLLQNQKLWQFEAYFQLAIMAGLSLAPL